MNNDAIAKQAHEDAQNLIDGGVSASDMETMNFMCAQLVSAAGFEGFAAQLYTERFVGHVINHACCGKGV